MRRTVDQRGHTKMFSRGDLWLRLSTLLLYSKLCCVVLALAGPPWDVRRAAAAAVALCGITLFGLIGGIIGQGKNRADGGAAWSMLLGPAGWFIADVVLCPRCFICSQLADREARSCSQCGAQLWNECEGRPIPQLGRDSASERVG